MYRIKVSWSDQALLGVDFEDLIGQDAIEYLNRVLEWEFDGISEAIIALHKLAGYIGQLDELNLTCNVALERQKALAERKQAALDKLTPEEKTLLGLK